MSSLSIASTGPTQQFGRLFSLLVSDSAGNTLDLSQLRCKFQVKKSGYLTPNVADIMVYNLDVSTANFIKAEFTRVIMQAGYAGNYGTIFKGNIKQGILGRENATDTFFNIIAGDGEQAFNFSVVNTTVGSASVGGASPADQLDAAINSMGTNGVGKGYVGPLPQIKLPRGKVMYGNARDYIQAVSDTNNLNWSIQDENIVILPESTYMPNQAVVLTTKTGMIGTPQQTVEGIMVKCLLNPKIHCHTRVQIDNKSVAQYKIDFSTPGSPANTPVAILNDGFYYVLVAEHSGDTRGTEWYTNLRMLTIDVSSNPLNNGECSQDTMDRNQLLNDSEAAVRTALDGRQAQIWTAMPGIVQSVDYDRMTLVAQLAIQGEQTNPNGSVTQVNISPLVDVPIVFPSAGGFSLTFPIVSGDEVLVIIASRCIDAWWQNGGFANVAMEARMHDLSDGFAIPGPRSQPRVISDISATNVQLRSDSGTVYIEITPSGHINLVAPLGVNITAPVNILGLVTVTGEVIANGIPLSTHLHTGVVSGPSNTGGPIP